jgi:N-acetylneuraminic acid mutarotase
MAFISVALGLCSSGSLARELTFDERVLAQEAIERVYYANQLGTKRAFAEAVPRALLEKKVRLYLKQSVALERLWNTPLTAMALEREVTRMVQGSRMPERLREIYAALGDEPFLIRECLARPLLADRLMHNFFAYDEQVHATAREEAKSLMEALRKGTISPHAEHPRRMVLDLVRIDSAGEEGSSASQTNGEDDPRSPRRLEMSPEELARARGALPERLGEISPVHERRESFDIGVVLDEDPSEFLMARFIVPKRSYDDWWAEIEASLDERLSAAADEETVTAGFDNSAATSGSLDDVWDNGALDDLPTGRSHHTAVWTGNQMIVWGGKKEPFSLFNTGGRYDPATDTWLPTSTVGAPSGRWWHTAVWTGSEMIIWGGSSATAAENTGARYDPTSDTWIPSSTADAPSPRFQHTAVWTGSRMVVWAGSYLATGGLYDPETDTWSPTSMFHPPTPRLSHTAVWTGTEMIVWGGTTSSGTLNTGARYDPVSNGWTTTSTVNAPSPRSQHTAVWTGNRMVVWGGNTDLDTGGSYDPGSNTWTPTATTGAPVGRFRHTAIWSGSRMVVWGGSSNPVTFFDSGGLYDPISNAWSPTSTLNAPAPRDKHTAVWTGDRMILWGGEDYYVSHNSGGRYDPLTDTWTPTGTGAPIARTSGAAVWTGSHMIVWGGDMGNPEDGGSACPKAGGRYDPATDTWTPTTTVGAPLGRELLTAVWTGDEMIVWGGTCIISNTATGGRYDPMADTWTPTSMVGVPTARNSHTAVWTGSEMIVWGTPADSSGGRYNPTTNTWAPTSMADAPMERWHHTAVWTGSEMIVWGGNDTADPVSTGGRYDPVTDTWTPTAMTDAPAARINHVAVWTGDEMVIWGGADGTAVAGGGRYSPVTDTWVPTAAAGEPTGRSRLTAVWTGALMIVWGGGSPQTNTGGRYDPVADAWTPTSLVDPPSPRRDHTAVWTGTEMIVWGGEANANAKLNSGGRYLVDADLDGVADGLDCAPLDDGAFGLAAEVTGLSFDADKATLRWNSAAPGAGVGTTHDVLRGALGDLPVGSGAAETCLETHISAAEAFDDDSLDPDAGFFYLVRASNSCGIGSWGSASDGSERMSSACP